MNKLAIIPVFFLTMCGTAPVTPPASALPEDAINKALMEFQYGRNDTTKSEELLQLPSD